LGKCFIALKRHCENVVELTPEEWTDLRRQIEHVTAALDAAFSPDHFNYAFLQNQDRHVHLHVIPRYAKDKTFAGATFRDSTYPGHYAVTSEPRLLTPDLVEPMIELVRDALQQLQARQHITAANRRPS
jgi:diadenosine tetraphosphate (Ap4A) HIT family hydrolase